MGLSNLRTLPRRFALLGAALLCLAAGCAQMGSARVPLTRIIRGPFGSQPSQPPADHYVGHLTVQGGKGPQGRDAYLPPPKDQPTGQAKDPLPVARLGFSLNADPNKVVPINLDTVLRLAEGQNGQTAIARAKLEAAQANVDLAAKAWLPDLWVGTGWYRHDGGIANEDGTLLHSSFSSMFAGLELHGNVNLRDAVFAKVDAERRVWQQKAEVSKLTSDALLEATATYMDLLTARAAEAVSVESEGKLRELLDKTTALAKSLPQFEVEVVRVRGELTGQQQLTRRFREGMLAATAKLIYLLGLDPSSELAVMDRRLVAFELVKADQTAEELVAQAQHQGPGVRELEGLLQLLHQANCKANGLSQYLPVLDLRVAEGGFGTGPGDRMDWDNRMDLGIQVRWNLTDWARKREVQRIANAKIGQAHLTYQDLQAKLAMGVQESREAALSGREQMELARKQVEAAGDALRRSQSRYDNAQAKDRVPSELLLSIRALTTAEMGYLQAIRDHDKAQLRLAIVTGAVGGTAGCER